MTIHLILHTGCESAAESLPEVLRHGALDPCVHSVGHDVDPATVLQESQEAQLVVLDIRGMALDDAVAMVRAYRGASRPLPVLAMDDAPPPRVTVALMKAGADDVLDRSEESRLAETIERIARAAPSGRLDELARIVFETAHEAIMVTDADNRILAVNSGFTATTGYSQDEAVGKTPALLKSGRQDDKFYLEMWRDITADGHWEGEIWNRRRSGEVYPEWLSVSVMRDGAGRIVRHVAIFSDISERKQNEEQLHYRAHYDPLTALPNRVLGMDRLAQTMASARRNSNLVAVMFVDLDGFKPVNDLLGHDAGDDVLRQVALRLRACVRQTDTVLRFGGDEFVIVVTDATSEPAARTVADHVLSATSRPFRVAEQEVSISASVGIALFPTHGARAEDLVRAADEAMYSAKRQGKNRYAFAPDVPVAAPALLRGASPGQETVVVGTRFRYS